MKAQLALLVFFMIGLQAGQPPRTRRHSAIGNSPIARIKKQHFHSWETDYGKRPEIRRNTMPMPRRVPRSKAWYNGLRKSKQN